MLLKQALDLLNITIGEYLGLPNYIPILCDNGDVAILHPGGGSHVAYSIKDYEQDGSITEIQVRDFDRLHLDFRKVANDPSDYPTSSRDGRGKRVIQGSLYFHSELRISDEYCIPKHYLPTDRVCSQEHLPVISLFAYLKSSPSSEDLIKQILTYMGAETMTSNTQTTVSNTVNALVDSNKASMITAAKLEVGNLAINLVTEQLLKILPPPASMILNDNPLFKVAVANLVQVLSTAIPVDDSRVDVVVDSMMTASYIELLGSFDLQGIVTDMLDKLPKSKLTTLTTTNQ